MSNGFETCDKHTYLFATETKDCPYCEIDRLNKEINRLRQYEDAITSAIDGTLLVWNLMSTNHTVIKNDYWQNHLEEIDRLKAELEFEQFSAKHSEEVVKERIAEVKDLERQLAEARTELERLTERLQANAAKIDEEDVVIEWADYLQLKAQARQEAAVEIIQYIIDQGIIEVGWNKQQVYEIDRSDIDELRQRYGLEE